MCLMLFATATFAQSDDFGVWASVAAEKKIDKRLSVGLEGEMRTRNNVGTFDRWSLGGDVDYKLLSWLKASAGYTFLWDHNARYRYDDDGDVKKEAHYWGPRHRVQVSLTGSCDVGPLELSLRERWQYTYRPEQTVDRYVVKDDDYESKTYSGKGKNVLRSRLQLSYKIAGCPVKPYVSAELYNAWSVEKVKYTVGANWKLNKQHTLGLYYRYQDVRAEEDEFDKVNSHILGVEYKFKF